MKKSRYTLHFVILFFCLMLVNSSIKSAQSLIINPASSKMTIYGTTNVHDWKSEIGKISGEMIIDNTNQIKSLEVEIPVRSIKSGEKLMDSKTYEAFNATKNPNISFKLLEVSSLNVTDKDISVIFVGNLTMSGVTKKVNIKSVGKSVGDGSYKFNGSVPLKMTDFKMKPPTAMLGVMKVGDGITIKFDITLSENNQASIGYLNK